MLASVLSVVAVVGFELLKYTVSEDVNIAEVCVQFFTPSPRIDLVFGIDMIIQPRIGTAGKFYSLHC